MFSPKSPLPGRREYYVKMMFLYVFVGDASSFAAFGALIVSRPELACLFCCFGILRVSEMLAICLGLHVLQPYWFVDENLSFPRNNFPRKTNAIPKKVFRVMVLKIEEYVWGKNCEFFSRRLSESKSCNCVLLRFLGHFLLSHKLKNYQVLR